MTGEPKRSGARGEQSRTALVEAGVALLGEVGWSGLTTRAIATRAGVNHGLVHYYFGGLDDLRRAVASTVIERSLLSVVDELIADDDWARATARFVAHSHEWAHAPESRQVAELISAALRVDEVRKLTAIALVEARRRTAAWLTQLEVTEPAALATVLVAMLDGLVLHRLIDERLDLHDTAHTIAQLQLHHARHGDG